MSDTWKARHIAELKKEKLVLEKQIELGKKTVNDNIQTLKEIREVISKLGEKDESI